METVLIDTDIAIDYLRGLTYAKEFVEDLWEKNAAFLSVLSVYELYAGMKEQERNVTQNFIDACNVETVIPEVAARGGEIYRNYRSKGVTITAIDCLIYATATLQGRTIATRNVKHYPDGDIILPV